MDPATFNNIKGALQQKHFKDEKFDYLRSSISTSYSYISVEQVTELVKEFNFDDEQLEVVKICSSKMYPASCAQVVPLLNEFSFDGSKVKVVEAIASNIVDPANHHELDRAITFLSDRKKAKEALLNRSSMGTGPHHPPHHSPQHPSHLPPHHSPHQPPHHSPQHPSHFPSHHSPHYPPHPPHNQPSYPDGPVPPPGPGGYPYPPAGPGYQPAPGYPPYPGTPYPMPPGSGNPLQNAFDAAHAAANALTRPHHGHHGHSPYH